MLDIKQIRENPEEVEKKIQMKEPESSLGFLLKLDTELRELKTEVEQLKADKNAHSKEIGLKKRNGEDCSALMKEMGTKTEGIHSIDKRVNDLQQQFDHEISLHPNLPMDDIKVAKDPSENVLIKSFGEKPSFSFPEKNHLELNEKLQLFDFVRGAKMSGTGWPVYRGMGAQIEWALINFMLQRHIQNGFEQWITPLLVRPEAMYASAQLPKFESQLFKINDDDYHLYLIPTSEAALNALHMNEIVEENELPKRYVAYTPCFRREAGAAGSQERGLIRVHQFNKVEMFAFTKPEDSMAMFDSMIASAESILEDLGMHYRSMLLVTGDMSFPSARTVDIEMWLPGQNRYYEVSSVSNCTDYQARRSNSRFRRDGGKPEFLHTLNGSGLATSRLMVGILENNQQEDGSVIIPEVLRPFLGGKEILTPGD
jgi:seryl-tRNA synthetase